MLLSFLEDFKASWHVRAEKSFKFFLVQFHLFARKRNKTGKRKELVIIIGHSLVIY